jgi:hypothetical protein
MEIFELESLAEELNRISANTHISAQLLKSKGMEDDSRTVTWDAKRIEEICDVVKEHVQLKQFLKNLVK